MDKLDVSIQADDAVVADSADAIDTAVIPVPEAGEVGSSPAPSAPSVPVEEIAPVVTDVQSVEVSEVIPEVAGDVSAPAPTAAPDSPIRANSSTPTPPSTPEPMQGDEEPRVTARVVEKIVEKEVVKEVIKEVPVEKIVEKIVEVEKPVDKIVEKVIYRDPDPKVCPPPTPEEVEAIKRDFLTNLSHEGTAKKHELMLEKMQKILTLFETKPTIMHKDVMELLDTSGTTATRLLTALKHEGKITQQGTRGNSASYTKP